MERLTPQEVNDLLTRLVPAAAGQADSLLDLRELLLSGGHPGKCVRCFFQISQAIEHQDDAGVGMLRRWLERHIELGVSSGPLRLETIPFRPAPGMDLETYCRQTIRNIRMDRAYRHRAITIRFQYREAA